MVRRVLTIRVADREGNEFRSWRFLAGETNGQASAERLEVLHEEFCVPATVAETHLIECVIEQITHLFQVAG